jgi:lysophospholipase L1-like esterase
MQRRRFLETATVSAMGLALSARDLRAENLLNPKGNSMPLQIKDGEVVLFQGDSITDAGRSRDNLDDLGSGYANLTSSWLTAAYPERKIHFINRGVSGNRVVDLRERWKTDCLDLKPNWVSILIGVNDTWRRYDSNDPTSVESYETGYRDLLTQIKERLNAQVILCEPFLLPISQDVERMREDLDPKAAVVRKLASEFKTRFLPLGTIFADACKHRDPAFWSADGVHPTFTGHALMTQAWIDSVSKA